MKRLFTLLFIAFSLSAIAQQKSILFLGNSYTATANLPGTLYNLAAAGGDTIITDSNTPGGYTLEGHSTNGTSLSKIASREWDFVVLQEQSQKPSFPPVQVAAETYPYAEVLVDSIKSNYQCTEPVFFMTWGRRDGDQQNCQFYSPLCTFEGMNARLRESYLEMGEDNDATVAPCGAAWYQMSVQNNSFWNGLYSGDGSHPSNWGTYLNACVFYATIFRQSPVGIPYYSSIGQQDAEDLQQLAEDIVLDSLSNWYIGHADVDSDASESMTGPFEYDFAANSQNATDHFWDFGDGQTSTDENPSHIFPTGVSATYEVMHVASSLCGSDTTYLNVTTSPSGIGNYNPLDELEIYTQAKSVVITNDLNCELNLSVLDLSGRTVKTELVGPRSQSIIELSLTSGVYLIRLENQNNASTRKVVLR